MREPCGVNIGGDGKIPPPILRCRWSPNECGLMLQMDLGGKKHDVNGFRVGVWGIFLSFLFLFFSFIPLLFLFSSFIPLFSLNSSSFPPLRPPLNQERKRAKFIYYGERLSQIYSKQR